jgi:hypothetical protein
MKSESVTIVSAVLPRSLAAERPCVRRTSAYPVVSADRNMLRLALFQHIAPASDAAVGRRRPTSPEPQQRLERCHGLLAAIVPKDELVEVSLELRAAHAVIGANQPLLQIADRAIGEWHDRFCTRAKRSPQWLLEGDMIEPRLLEAGEAPQAIGVKGGAWRNLLFDQRRHRRRRKVSEDGHANSPRALAPSFHGDQYWHGVPTFQLSAASKPRLRPANPGVVDLDLTMQRLARHIDHGPPELVKHHPSGFIPSQSKLALKQERRDSARVGCHQVRRPKPVGQRSLRVVKNRPRRQRNLVPTGGALPTPIRHKGVRTPMVAARAREAIWPAAGRQILLAGLFGRELTLKLAQILGERRARHARTLQIVPC